MRITPSSTLLSALSKLTEAPQNRPGAVSGEAQWLAEQRAREKRLQRAQEDPARVAAKKRLQAARKERFQASRQQDLAVSARFAREAPAASAERPGEEIRLGRFIDIKV